MPSLVFSLLPLALLIAPQGDFARDALNLGRTHDQALYDSFNAGYRLTPSGGVERVEMITEFRRAVMIVRQHAEQGEYSFDANDLQAALAPYRGVIAFVVDVRLHPLNTFAKPPAYDVYVRTGRDTKPLPATGFKREALYPPGLGAPGAAMTGIRLEASFPRVDVANAADPLLVVTDDRGDVLWQGRIDLARFR